MKRPANHIVVSLLALSAAMPAFAQSEQPAPPEAEESGRDVIIITANKREETVQDVAVAVTALSSEAKEQLGIISVTDLTNVTPGLSYTPGNERVTLRGIGRLSNSFGADPGVANYNDGLYTAFAVMAGKDPFLVDRVEVLRGPQGTLYGRNAIGGAINTISKRPTDEFQIDAVLGAGNFDARKAGVAVSGPINDSLRYRVAGFREQRNGIDLNYGLNETEGWEIDDYYIEAQLEGDIGDRFTWWLKVADLGYDKAGPPGGRTAGFSNAPYLNGVFSTGGLSPNNAFAYGNPAVVSYTQGGPRTDNPFATNGEHAYNSNYTTRTNVSAYDEAIFEAIYEADGFDIKYTGGYTFYDYDLFSDADGTPIKSITYNAITGIAPIPACSAALAARGAPVGTLTGAAAGCQTATAPRTIYPNVLNVYEEGRSLFSNEINFISTADGPLQWIAGAYQYQENSDQPGQQQFLTDEPLAASYLDPVLGFVANPNRNLQHFRNVSLFHAYGVYGQADYSFNDQWKLTGGLRWSKDVKESKEEGFVACYIICEGSISPALAVPYFNYTRTAFAGAAYADVTYDSRGWATRRLQGSWDAVTGTIGAEFRPMDGTLLFGKYSRGYKAGGFNNLGFAATPYTDSETVDAYEGGWKQEWFDYGLTTNAAVFMYSYKDMQAPLSVIENQGQVGQRSYTAFINVPEAETTGFELEGNWNPIDPLNIGFTYAYLNAEVVDTEGLSYVNTARDPRCIEPGNTANIGSCNTVRTQLNDPLRLDNVTGNKLAQSPEHKVAINASYRFDFEDGSWLLPTMSYSWRDEFYDSFFNDANELAPASEQLDARLNWYSADEAVSLTLWVRNLTDDDQFTSVSANGYRLQDLGRYQSFNYSLPRTFGVDLRFHFE